MLTFRDEAAVGASAMLREWAKFVAANSFGFAVNYGVYAGADRFRAAAAEQSLSRAGVRDGRGAGVQLRAVAKISVPAKIEFI